MKRLTSLIAFLILAAGSFAQTHFTPAYTGNGQDHMNIYVVTATIGGVALEAGDEIAVFDGSICCGIVVLTQPINISNSGTYAAVAASRKDDGQSNGYTVGNQISYKFWDASKGLEHSGITADYLDISGNPTAAPTFSVNASAIVKLSVAGAANNTPVASAGADQTVDENTTVTLDGSGSSDPDGNTLIYKWTAPAGITLSSSSAQKPTFTAPDVTSNTNYTITLVVNDGQVDSPADQVIVTVRRGNNAPTANAGTDQSVNEGAIVTLDGTASTDPDGDALTYTWTAPAGITLSSASAQKPTFTAPEVSADTQYAFSLIVNDGFVNSSADQVIITVKQVNKAPTANAGPDQSVLKNTLVTLDGSGSSDSDGGTLTYQWTVPAGVTLSSNSAQKPTFTAPDVTVNTDYTFILVVNDGQVNSPADQVKITVLRGNLAPTANAGTDQTVNENTTVTLDGTTSTDPDGDALTYLWTAPAGIILSATTASKPTFTAPEVSADTQYTFSLVVNDGTVNSVADQVLVAVKQVNKAPVANAGVDQSVNENTLFTLDGSASFDADSDLLTYKWTAPAGITLSSSSVARPTFTTPDVNSNTSYTFTLVVNDGKLDSPADQVVITVKQDNKAPTANAGMDQSVNEGVIVTLDGTASTDPDGDALTYTWTVPVGLTLSSASAQKPTFTAPEVSADTQYTFSLVVNDGTANSVANQVIITVKQVNKAPTANAGPDKSILKNTLVTLDGSGSSDPDGNTLTYQWTAPAGVTLSSTSAQKPTFTAPDVTVNTDYTFTLVVNDGHVNSPADQIKITVLRGNLAPTANAGTDQPVNEGFTVSLDGSASSDPDGNALTFFWTAPTGITLSSASSQKPTFTAPEVSADTQYTFSLVVNDGTVNSVADQVIITVKNVDHEPYVKDPIKDVSVENGALPKVIDLNSIFADDDTGDILKFVVSENSNDKIVTALITETYLILNFSAENFGLANIMITASSNGKEAKSNFKVEVKKFTGIDPVTTDADLLLYPNPSKGIVNLKFINIPKTETWITVTDISGKIVSKLLTTKEKEQLNLKGNPSGLYFIRVDNKFSKTYKILLQ
ncbi:MAG TPA: hypothetical protein DHV48_09340 [Prolixibacteraceae bacterium]|nr:hypothetical protein [Prolixibacteraceae bacterium]